MPIHYQIWADQRMVIEALEGAMPSVTEVDAIRGLVAADPAFSAAFDLVLDLRSLDPDAAPVERSLRDLVLGSIYSRSSRRALLALTPEQHRIADRFLVLFESLGAETRVFAEPASLCRWLGAETEPGGVGLGPFPTIPWSPSSRGHLEAIAIVLRSRPRAD